MQELKDYKQARMIFYNAKVRQEFTVSLGVRNAFYEVRKRHQKKVEGYRVFKSKKINELNYKLWREY